MIEMTGDIFDTKAQAIGHGVNVLGVMGAGIALQFKTKFPDMYQAYAYACANGGLEPGGVYAYMYEDLIVYNIASQANPGADARLEWLESGLYSTAEHAWSLGLDLIALPHIGCGIGGLSLTDVAPLLLDIESYTGVEFELWTYSN